jgi:D-alanyl-D-alanine carboxypeptidase
MTLKRRMRKLWRMLLKRIGQMKASTKRAILIFTLGIVVGSLVGNWVGTNKVEKEAALVLEQTTNELKSQHEQELTALKAEHEKQIEKYETEVELPWYLVLVNDTHPMEKGYVPNLVYFSPDREIDERIAEAAHQMLDDAKAAGKSIYIGSVYRSLDDQARIFNYSMEDRRKAGMSYWEAYQDVSLLVAEPGTSEHALGLALDLQSNYYTNLDEGQERTAEAKWLKENCYKYGFILRYPPGKEAITGISYEPWHYRYVGVEDATRITELGLTLEEYLEEYYGYK